MANPQTDTSRMGWAPTQLHLQVLGSPLSIHFDTDVTKSQADDLKTAWSRCLANEGSAFAPPHAVNAERQAVFQGRVRTGNSSSNVDAGTFAQFASQLTSVVTMAGIETRAGELMMLHASGLAQPSTGRTAALVGPSGMGKTTATRILGARYGYVTDETLAISRTGNIVPYPKPLSVVQNHELAPKAQIGPDELGLLHAPAELTLAAVILLDRNPTVDKPVVTPLRNAEAIIELIPQTSSLARIHKPLQWLCTILDNCGGAVRVTYREARDLFLVLPELLQRTPAQKEDWSAVVENEEPTSASNPLPGTVRRAQLIDVIEFAKDEEAIELLAMAGNQVLRLGGIAPAIWHATRTPAHGINEIARRIAAQNHLPHGYEKTLSEALENLESNGILTRT